MRAIAYIDTSFLIAIILGEPEGAHCTKRLEEVDRIYSSNLLEAEVRATLAREKVVTDAQKLLAPIRWVMPNAPLSGEIGRVLSEGYVRGADLWHLATALELSPVASEILFLTLDKRQGEIAAKLGFAVE